MAPGAAAASALKALTRLVLERPWWLLALLVAAAATVSTSLQRLNLLAYDLLAPRMELPARSVLVAVDEASIMALGQWPWPREVHARMVDRLAAAGAAGVAFAVLFSEPQTHSPEPEAGDKALAAALGAYGKGVLAVAPVSRLAAGGVTELGPLPILRRVAHLGHVDLEIDADGVVRRLFLRGGARAELPALAVALVEEAQPVLTQRPLPGLRAQQLSIAKPGVWQRDNEVLLPHAATLPGSAWSFAEALTSPEFAEAVRGRAVLIGVTAR
ncbi:MAG: CHASE2 domain-containing protein, partial [Burkholderiales bacterium]